ncbi:uncharacterized protein TNCV_3145421 [Trichonephila clavipes]|nr:uncharacterized protein TNCV_3145421 [Trichonephila clavipes]
MASSNTKLTIWDLPNSEKDAVAFFQNYNILPNGRKCTNSHSMKLYFGKRIFWKCGLGTCNQMVAIRNGNWFEASRLPFLIALRFIYCWAKKLTTIKFCEEQLNLADKTVTDWNNYMREICVLDMERKEIKIEGPKRIVEMWRKNQEEDNKDCFDSVLKSISLHFPPKRD